MTFGLKIECPVNLIGQHFKQTQNITTGNLWNMTKYFGVLY